MLDIFYVIDTPVTLISYNTSMFYNHILFAIFSS